MNSSDRASCRISRSHTCSVGNCIQTKQSTSGSIFSIVVFAIAQLFIAQSAMAATLNVTGGQLMGASGVDVSGSFFNVLFVDGTCIDLYSGCDDATDFAFATSGEALAAALALLDQVLLDVPAGQFDNEPALTNGCIVVSGCAINIPFDVVIGIVSVRAAVNGLANSDTTSAIGMVADNVDSSQGPSSVYAVFTPVPEPSTAVLVGLGLLGLSLRRPGSDPS